MHSTFHNGEGKFSEGGFSEGGCLFAYPLCNNLNLTYTLYKKNLKPLEIIPYTERHNYFWTLEHFEHLNT